MFFARNSLFLEGLLSFCQSLINDLSCTDLFYDSNDDIIVKIVSSCVM